MFCGRFNLENLSLRPGVVSPIVNGFASFAFFLLHGAVLLQSGLSLDLYENNDASNTPLWILNIISAILALLALWRIVIQEDTVKLSKVSIVFVARNALSSLSLFLVFLYFGLQDHGSVSVDRTALNWLIILVSVSHGLQVLVNKKIPDEPDCDQGPVTLKEALPLDLLLLASGLCFIFHVENKTGEDDLFSRDTDVARVTIAASFLLGIHVLLQFVTFCLRIEYLQNLVLGCFGVTNEIQDTDPLIHCKDENGNTGREILPLNRVPLYRHLVASSVLACLSYVWGHAYNEDAHHGGGGLMIWATLLYLFADIYGRGNDRVIG